MSKMPPEERQRRRDRVAAEALESVAKSEQFNFRMDAKTVKRLHAIAAEQRKPVGALVREWVIEKAEGQQQAPSNIDLLNEISILRNQTMIGLQNIVDSIESKKKTGYSVSEPHAASQLRFKTTGRTDKVIADDLSKTQLTEALKQIKPISTSTYEVPGFLVDIFLRHFQMT